LIRSDYILRMIEEFFQMLSRIRSLKAGQRLAEASATLDEGYDRLLGVGVEEAARLSETELLARLIQREPTQAVREKALILTALLKESGDIAVAEGREDEGRAYYIKGLHLLIGNLGQEELSERPDFIPQVDAFVLALQGEDLPLATQAMLMRHYEQSGQFAKAEDALFGLLESEPQNPRIVELGLSFYDRLMTRSDAALLAGNLPRTELEAGLSELRDRRAALTQRTAE
jgi:Family of unknown function (DUF6483)